MVLRYLGDNVQILYPNGNVSERSGSGEWTSVNQEGTQLITNESGSQTKTIKADQERDPAQKQITIHREDMVNILIQEDGKMVAEHVDGTVITSWSEEKIEEGAGGKVIVQGRGFATVEYSNNNENILVEFPDGTVVERKSAGNGEFTISINKVCVHSILQSKSLLLI